MYCMCVVAGGWPVLAIVGAPPVHQHTNTCTDTRVQVVVESHLPKYSVQSVGWV